MKNIVKRIAAMGAAVMMMSSMAIGASAADSKAFSLRNTPGAPSSDNVTSKTLNFKTTQSGKYTTYTKLTASKNTTVYDQVLCLEKQHLEFDHNIYGYTEDYRLVVSDNSWHEC